MQTSREKINAMRAEEAKRDRNKKILWGSVGALSVAALVGATSYAVMNRPEAVTATPQGQQLTPQYATAEGSYRLMPDGGVDTSVTKDTDTKKGDGVHTLLIFDPQCPGCGAFERGAGSAIAEANKKGSINLYLAPVSFLGKMSSDDYSMRAANAVVTVAEKDPSKTLAFVQEIYKEGNQPGEGANYKAVSDDTIKGWARSVGVKEEVSNSFTNLSYKDWLSQSLQRWGGRTDLFPDGQLSTPGFFMGGSLQKGKTTKSERVDLDPNNLVGSFQEALARKTSQQ